MAASSFRFVWTHIAAGSFFDRRRCAAAYGATLGRVGRVGGLFWANGGGVGLAGVMGRGVLRDPVFEARKEFSWLSNR